MSSFPYRLLGNRAAIRVDFSHALQGGIALPQNLDPVVLRGEVVAVGPGPLTEDGRRIPLPVETGQRVTARAYHCETVPGYEHIRVVLGPFLDLVLEKQARPLWDRVLVADPQPVGRSAGEILLPETVAKTVFTGRVLRVGPGMLDAEGRPRPVPVSAGEQVYFQRFSGQPFCYNDETFMIVRPADLLSGENQ